MELWDVYDKDRNKTGRTMVRGSAFQEGDYHLVVHICIFNSRNEMLIQKRQPFKDNFSGMWDITVGGSAVAGDTSQQAAARELLEEVGIQMDFTDVRPQLSVHFDHGFDDYYLARRDDLDVASLKLQYEEVEQVTWATEDEVLSLLASGEFIPYHASFLQLLFAMQTSYGAHKK